MEIKKRLKQLEKYFNGKNVQGAAFRLEDESLFIPDTDPVSYLIQNGVETPKGKIVGIKRPKEELDPITEALYYEIERCIKDNGKWI